MYVVYCPFHCLVKISSGKMSFLSHPDLQLIINHTGLCLSLVKEKDKKWGHGLALKVFILFKNELVCSIWKAVIWKYNFSNSLKIQRSSQNVKFDGYREKENSLSCIQCD